MTLAAAVTAAAAELRSGGLPPESASFDASLLARYVLGWDLAAWVIRQREEAPSAFTPAFAAVIDRRRRREPVAYIVGSREFYGRSFVVTPDVLIPRPETEIVVEQAISLTKPRELASTRAADVGTGSGCLAVTLALERPDVQVIATDISAEALTVAAENARRLGATDRVSFHQSSLVPAGRFDLVVSNPPYVAEGDRHRLAPDVRDFEPPAALFAGSDGLAVIRALVPAAAAALTAGGWLVMEIGAGQADAVINLARVDGRLDQIRNVPDLAGIPRVLVARRRDGSV